MIKRSPKLERVTGVLTVNPGVGAADGGYGRAAGHDELVRHTLVVRGLGLGEDHVVQVQPGQGRVRRGRRGSSDYRGSGEVTSNHGRSDKGSRIYRRSWESPVTTGGG